MSAVVDPSDCPCRATDALCQKCYYAGLRRLYAAGFGRDLARLDAEIRQLERIQRDYLRRSNGWNWKG